MFGSKFLGVIAAGMLALASVAVASNANAAVITINSTTPTWSNAVGGSGVMLNAQEGAYTTTRWGTPVGGINKSGLGFDPANPPSSAVVTDTNFLLGTLQHYNNPIAAGTAVASVDLALSTAIAGAVPLAQSFAYRFLIDETPNAFPCAYPSGTNPCADKITFQNLDTSNSFSVNGIAYTIALSGFSTDGGLTFSPDFISQEGTTNAAGLYARITAPTPVPEPASMAIFGAGLLGLGFAKRRRSNKSSEIASA